MLVRRNDQRVDFQHGHVFGNEGGIKLLDDNASFLRQISAQFQRLRNRAAVMRHDAGRGIHREGDDLFRRCMRHLFDIHAAFCRNNKSDPRRCAIHQH